MYFENFAHASKHKVKEQVNITSSKSPTINLENFGKPFFYISKFA